ncbi:MULTISPECIES: ABC transporter substrate-binding protein [unclassified Roseateles]|uniref:substrate-binding periplasmic protein n=1 Tax=unclassified Roseateles TaxID=2626991 RepID=UPI0006FCB13B|nr:MULTISPECIES: transporter substrate-binding domain-containing protein [unclassified Roseateles]KQW42778.1 hypothetical protein ASC81_19145 [Pelomonas sp. Root405]KRA69455.1 hypothetical protein ASD88_19795 [Pelomonas sp. Root662]
MNAAALAFAIRRLRRPLAALFGAMLGSVAVADGAGMCLKRPIRFTHYEFGLIYSAGQGGIDDDLQKELARRSGCRFETMLWPRARTWQALRTGEIDMAGSGIPTPERDAFAWFYPYIVEDNVVVLGTRVPADVHSFEQFIRRPDLTFGGVRSYRYSPYYDRHVDELIAARRLKEATDPGALFRMFTVPRFDAFITSPILYLHYVKKRNLPAPARIEDWDPAGATPSGLVLSKASFTPAQARKWGDLMNQMLADGTVERIVVKHMGAEHGPATVYRPNGH